MTYIIDKKTSYSIHSGVEGISSGSDVGSNDSPNICSGSNIENKTKQPKCLKDYLNKFKKEQNSRNIRKASNTKIVNKGSSAAQHMATAPRIFFGEVDKKDNSVPKEKQRRKNSYIRTTKSKDTDNNVTDTPANQSNESVASVFSSESSGTEVNLRKNIEPKSRSLTNLKKVECKASLSAPSPLTGSSLALKYYRPLDFEYDYTKLSSQRRHFDYLREFDLIRNVGLFNHFTRSMQLSENAKEIFSLVPKLSPSSEPLTLQRRPYSCGVLSIKNSQNLLQEIDKNEKKRDLTETTMKIKIGSSDDCCSSAESDNSVFLDDGHITARYKRNKDTILIVKKPIRVKYIDEATKKIKELILYSDECLTNMIKEKGSSASKNKVFECLLKQSTDYKGVSVRVITDAKKFFNNIRNYKKAQGDRKPSSTFQMPKQASSKISKKATREHTHTKKNSNVPLCTRSCEGLREKERTSHQKHPFEQKVLHRKDDKDEPQKSSFPGAESLKLLKYKRSRSLQNKLNDSNTFEVENGRQSRIALKRVNIEEIIASNFSEFFHFYAKLGGRLKSGAAISRKNSSLWLKRCGIITDEDSENVADNYFLSMASTKSILNISDYIQYLVKIARDKRMLLVDVIKKMVSVEPYLAEKPTAKHKAHRSKF